MSNLMPEARVNKLGHVVTKHVRAQSPGGANHKTIPAPSLKEPAQRKQATKDAIATLRSAGLPLSNVNYTNKNVFHLVNKNPELLERLVSHIQRADEREKAVWNSIVSGESRYAVEKGSSYDASFEYERDMELVPLACQLVEEPKSHGGFAQRMIAETYLRLGETIDPEDFKLMGAAMIAIAVETSYCDKTKPYVFDYQGHSEAISYIAENTEKVVPIVSELIARETVDRSTIEMLLGVSSQSLREGAL